MFKQPLWMITAAHYVGITSIIAGLYLISTGYSLYWLILWGISHILGSLMLSVGLHRYFSHSAFKTSKFWHIFMSYYSVLLVNGSPLGWAAAHNTHHVYSDTDKDPHYANWWYLIHKKYRDVKMVMRQVRVLAKDKTVSFVHRYGALLWLIFSALVISISWKVYLFAYLMPLGSIHIIGAIHQVLSHKNKQPRDLPLLEFIFPACGEWLHKTHHEHPGWKDFRTKWYHVDIGAKFVKLIER